MPKVTVGDAEVYLDPSRLPEFSYSLNDLTDPSKVRGARSTTFDIPATNGARQVLGGVTLAEETDASLPFRIGDGGVTLFAGTCVPTEWADGRVSVNAFGDNAGWFSAAKATKLQDLNLGTSGTINAAYQEASWTDQDQADVYPLIDYGAFVDRASTYDVGVGQLRPGLRVHRILSEFYAANGYTVEARGRLKKHWKKLFLPNTGRIKISDAFAAGYSASLRDDIGVIPEYRFDWPGTAPAPIVSNGATVVDPSTSITGTTYTAALAMRVQVRLTGEIAHAPTVPFAPLQVMTLAVYNATNVLKGTFNYQAGTFGTTKVFEDQVLWEGDIVIGETLNVGLYWSGSGSASIFNTTASVTVAYKVVNIEYQEGVELNIAETAPKMTVADFVSGLCNILRLTARTDDATHTVTFSYYDDFLKKETEGIDWRERIDHAGLEKVQPTVPAAFNFTYKEDTNDQYLRDFREAQDREYGSYQYTTGGTDGEVNVSVPFAATAQRLTFDNIVIPALRKEGPYYQQDAYEWQPRILVLDGMEEGEWTFDGVAQTEFPRSYFVGTKQRDISLAFGDETENGGAVRGTVFTRWANYLRRQVSPYLRCRVRVYDDEFMGFSFDRPRLVHDGWHQRWCYVGEIKGKRFGDEAFVECDMIPM